MGRPAGAGSKELTGVVPAYEDLAGCAVVDRREVQQEFEVVGDRNCERTEPFEEVLPLRSVACLRQLEVDGCHGHAVVGE